MRRHGRSFFFASRFLPPPVRTDVFTLYAFCRTADDLVDEHVERHGRSVVLAQLSAWQDWLRARPVAANDSGPTANLAAVINKYGINGGYLAELLEGCKGDLASPSFEEFPQLARYCYQMGSTVGLAMAPVLGVQSKSGLAAARELGMAMQLTNIIRDLRPDVAAGRRYLPAVEVRRFGCQPEAPERSGDLAGLVRFQVGRAREWYQAAQTGFDAIESRSRFAIRLSAALYEAILDRVAAQSYDVYRGRAVTSLAGKLRVAVRLRLQG